VGVDSSAPILEAARESHGQLPGVGFVLGDAASTELAYLVEQLRSRLPAGPLEERDRWTLWRATIC
jgi:hypothetical protein